MAGRVRAGIAQPKRYFFLGPLGDPSVFLLSLCT